MKKSVLKDIRETVDELTTQCGTRDPVKMCCALGIHLYYYDFHKKLKGYYVNKFGIHNIILDSNLSEEYIPIIIAHELGHFALHGAAAAYQDIGIHDSLDSLEVQAHFFCAELLLPDHIVLAALEEYNSFEAAAKSLAVPFDLLDYKLQMMNAAELLTIKDLHYARRNFLHSDIY